MQIIIFPLIYPSLWKASKIPVLWLYIVTLNEAIPPKADICSANEFHMTSTNPTLTTRVTPPWDVYMAKFELREVK